MGREDPLLGKCPLDEMRWRQPLTPKGGGWAWRGHPFKGEGVKALMSQRHLNTFNLQLRCKLNFLNEALRGLDVELQLARGREGR